MGKIRVKTFDENQGEKDAKLEARREAKKAEKAALKAARKEDEPKAEDAVETVVKDIEVATETAEEAVSAKSSTEPKKESKYAAKKGLNKKSKSKRYQETVSMVDRKKSYKLAEAVELLKKFKKAKFDETVELHVNVREKGINGQVTLPHGTGKTRRIKVVDDATIASIEKGVIDFDVLVAHPSMMPKLARVARVLGPRGLMPNPKAGTVTDKVEQAVEKLAGGQVNYKTESAAPIIHMSVGKASFDNAQIEENVKTVIASVGTAKIESATIKLTMSPGIKLDVVRSI